MIIVLSVLLAVAAAIIFCLCRVLKNTYLNIYPVENMVERKSFSIKKAYNGIYYPAHILAQIEFGSPQEMKIVDFSMYNKYKVVGITVYTTDALEDYYGDVVTELEELNKDLTDELDKDLIDELIKDLIDELTKPVLLKNKIIFEIEEGNWTWKSPD